jgi:hypothetical protein
MERLTRCSQCGVAIEYKRGDRAVCTRCDEKECESALQSMLPTDKRPLDLAVDYIRQGANWQNGGETVRQLLNHPEFAAMPEGERVAEIRSFCGTGGFVADQLNIWHDSAGIKINGHQLTWVAVTRELIEQNRTGLAQGTLL